MRTVASIPHNFDIITIQKVKRSADIDTRKCSGLCEMSESSLQVQHLPFMLPCLPSFHLHVMSSDNCNSTSLSLIFISFPGYDVGDHLLQHVGMPP